MRDALPMMAIRFLDDLFVAVLSGLFTTLLLLAV